MTNHRQPTFRIHPTQLANVAEALGEGIVALENQLHNPALTAQEMRQLLAAIDYLKGLRERLRKHLAD